MKIGGIMVVVVIFIFLSSIAYSATDEKPSSSDDAPAKTATKKPESTVGLISSSSSGSQVAIDRFKMATEIDKSFEGLSNDGKADTASSCTDCGQNNPGTPPTPTKEQEEPGLMDKMLEQAMGAMAGAMGQKAAGALTGGGGSGAGSGSGSGGGSGSGTGSGGSGGGSGSGTGSGGSGSGSGANQGSGQQDFGSSDTEVDGKCACEGKEGCKDACSSEQDCGNKVCCSKYKECFDQEQCDSCISTGGQNPTCTGSSASCTSASPPDCQGGCKRNAATKCKPKGTMAKADFKAKTDCSKVPEKELQSCQAAFKKSQPAKECWNNWQLKKMSDQDIKEIDPKNPDKTKQAAYNNRETTPDQMRENIRKNGETGVPDKYPSDKEMFNGGTEGADKSGKTFSAERTSGSGADKATSAKVAQKSKASAPNTPGSTSPVGRTADSRPQVSGAKGVNSLPPASTTPQAGNSRSYKLSETSYTVGDNVKIKNSIGGGDFSGKLQKIEPSGNYFQIEVAGPGKMVYYDTVDSTGRSGGWFGNAQISKALSLQVSTQVHFMNPSTSITRSWYDPDTGVISSTATGTSNAVGVWARAPVESLNIQGREAWIKFPYANAKVHAPHTNPPNFIAISSLFYTQKILLENDDPKSIFLNTYVGSRSTGGRVSQDIIMGIGARLESLSGRQSGPAIIKQLLKTKNIMISDLPSLTVTRYPYNSIVSYTPPEKSWINPVSGAESIWPIPVSNPQPEPQGTFPGTTIEYLKDSTPDNIKNVNKIISFSGAKLAKLLQPRDNVRIDLLSSNYASGDGGFISVATPDKLHPVGLSTIAWQRNLDIAPRYSYIVDGMNDYDYLISKSRVYAKPNGVNDLKIIVSTRSSGVLETLPSHFVRVVITGTDFLDQ